ncbi:MAG: AAA family ATPase [Rhodospirillaceae bacterium]
MNILAIRGKNLASLAGEFEIDLTAAPLDRAGLFAITGPTGAGKSTILDALTLALFHKIPRLPSAGGVKAVWSSDPELSTTDERSILSRGAISGYAEVDFQGRDGVLYRARWDVRRARGRANGQLQKVEAKLTRLEDGQGIGDGITATRERIEEKLGLNFDQFRRAVVLAQGDFANFLKASAADRSALLEQITGTEIYSKLSKAAFLRDKDAGLVLKEIKARRDDLIILEPDARTILEQELVAATTELTKSEQALEHAKSACLWHEQMTKLVTEAADARTALALACTAVDAARLDRQELADVQAAQRLRPLVEAADHTTEKASTAAATAVRAGTTHTEARTAREAASVRLNDAKQNLTEVRARQDALAPELEQAGALDRDIETISAEHTKEEQDRARAARDAGEAGLKLVKIDREIEKLTGEIDEKRGWLNTQATLAPIAAQWPRWAGALDRAGAAEQVLTSNKDRITALSSDINRMEAALPALDHAKTEAEAAFVETQLQLNNLRAQPTPSMIALRTERTALEQEYTTLQEKKRTAEEAKRQLAIATKAEALGATTKTEIDRTALLLTEAEAALERIKLARRPEVKELRAALEPGQPCPVCGSTEHPLADTAQAPLDAVAADQQDRVNSLRTSKEKLERTLGGYLSEARQARETAAKAEAVDIDAIMTRLATLSTAIVGVHGREQAANEHNNLLIQAGQRHQEAGKAARATKDALDKHNIDLTARRNTRTLAENLSTGAARDLEAALDEVAEAFTDLNGWQTRRATDAKSFKTDLNTQVQAYKTTVEALTTAEKQLSEQRAGHQSQVVRHEAAIEALNKITGRTTELRDRLNLRRTARAGLLAGRTVTEVRQELKKLLDEAEATFTKADKTDRETANALTAAKQALDTATTEAARCETARHLAAAALAECGLAPDELRRRLSFDLSWQDARARHLAALDKAAHSAVVLVEERERQVTRHANRTDAATGARDEAEAALVIADGAVSEHRTETEAFRQRLALDDNSRRRREALEPEYQTCKAACALWGALNSVIGSENGTKFRKYAQSLSLGQLLGHANLHLTELARRYRLEQAPGADLDLLVVDCDMADERRGVHSLSGGETFLISLALALGLSSMTGDGARIGTLFIDEGFGALDPDSLDIALSCLESLQAAGRTVGVVSHVPAMIERISVQVRVTPCGGGRSTVSTDHNNGKILKV